MFLRLFEIIVNTVFVDIIVNAVIIDIVADELHVWLYGLIINCGDVTWENGVAMVCNWSVEV